MRSIIISLVLATVAVLVMIGSIVFLTGCRSIVDREGPLFDSYAQEVKE